MPTTADQALYDRCARRCRERGFDHAEVILCVVEVVKEVLKEREKKK